MPSSRLGAWTWLWEGRSALQLPQPCGPAADGAREGLETASGPEAGGPQRRASRKHCLLPWLYPGWWGSPFLLGISAALPRCLFCLCWILQEEEALGGNSTARFSQLFKSFGGQLNLGSCQSSVWSRISVLAMQGAASSYRLGQGLPGARRASV